MNVAVFIINILLTSFAETFNLVGVLIAVGFLLGHLEKQSNAYLVRALGRQGVFVTAWIGTPIHYDK